MTSALYDLRAAQLGLSLNDLESITMGMFCDMFTERANDDYNYAALATQEDMQNFFQS